VSISNYIKVIGRGKDSARDLSRVQANDLMSQVLDGTVSELELGAFVIAMRIKGETPQEIAGFLDALDQRLHKIPNAACPTVVLPSYNGARKLPVLTPLLALLLAREGLAVVVHGSNTESTRISAQNIFLALNIKEHTAIEPIASAEVQMVPTALLHGGLQRLLAVRQVVGLRNSAHSLVKLMNPCTETAVVVGSFTHPQYATSMAACFELMGADALLLHGTEGEPVADARRIPAMTAFRGGHPTLVQQAQIGTLSHLPELPSPDAQATARWIRSVMDGRVPVPEPIARQAAHIVELSKAIRTTP
jgi:anthranilate phosphoribosyltransferase